MIFNKRFKPVLFLLVAAIVVAPLLGGCFKKKEVQETPETQAMEDNSNITIGFSIHGLEVDRWKREKEMAEKYALKKGFNLLVMDAEKNTKKQIKQCENLIYQGVDVLILIPEDEESGKTIANFAKEHNVPLIAYDRLINDAPVTYYVTFDQKKVGVLQAKVLTDLYPEGRYVHLRGADSDFNTTYFTGGNMEVLDPYIKSGKIKIIASDQCLGWYRNEAYKFMKNVLKETTDITVALAPNDDTARAVIQALDESGLAGKVGVSGQDAELESIKYILEGKQTMTVYKPIKTMNEVALNFALDIAKGQKPETNGFTNNGYIDVPTYFIDVIAVTKDNIDSTVINDGFYTREEVYGTSSK